MRKIDFKGALSVFLLGVLAGLWLAWPTAPKARPRAGAAHVGSDARSIRDQSRALAESTDAWLARLERELGE